MTQNLINTKTERTQANTKHTET